MSFRKMPHLITLAFMAIYLSSKQVQSFTSRVTPRVSVLTTTRLLSSPERNEEIAALEEKLQRLKDEENQKKAEAESSADDAALMDEGEGVPELYEEMLSEQWKEFKSSEEFTKSSKDVKGSGVLTTVLGVVASVIFLGLFSQVPIGQEDLSRYSANREPTTLIDFGDLNPIKKVSEKVYTDE